MKGPFWSFVTRKVGGRAFFLNFFLCYGFRWKPVIILNCLYLFRLYPNHLIFLDSHSKSTMTYIGIHIEWLSNDDSEWLLHDLLDSEQPILHVTPRIQLFLKVHFFSFSGIHPRDAKVILKFELKRGKGLPIPVYTHFVVWKTSMYFLNARVVQIVMWCAEESEQQP